MCTYVHMLWDYVVEEFIFVGGSGDLCTYTYM